MNAFDPSKVMPWLTSLAILSIMTQFSKITVLKKTFIKVYPDVLFTNVEFLRLIFVKRLFWIKIAEESWAWFYSNRQDVILTMDSASMTTVPEELAWFLLKSRFVKFPIELSMCRAEPLATAVLLRKTTFINTNYDSLSTLIAPSFPSFAVLFAITYFPLTVLEIASWEDSEKITGYLLA